LCTIGGNANWCSHCGKTVWRFLKKLKIEILYDPVYPKKKKNTNLKRYMDPCVYCSIIYSSQDMETT